MRVPHPDQGVGHPAGTETRLPPSRTATPATVDRAHSLAGLPRCYTSLVSSLVPIAIGRDHRSGCEDGALPFVAGARLSTLLGASVL
jgi:hypothetical protein